MSIVLLNGQNLTVINDHYGHSAKILGYGYCSTGPISIGLLSLDLYYSKLNKTLYEYQYRVCRHFSYNIFHLGGQTKVAY